MEFLSATSKKYVPPVHGRQSEVSAIRTRVDPAELGRYMDLVIDFVDWQPDDTGPTHSVSLHLFVAVNWMQINGS